MIRSAAADLPPLFLQMKTIRIGITGASGFIGRHLGGRIMVSEELEQVPFQREWFGQPERMKAFLASCDAVVHLAAVSRHGDGDFLYRVNVAMTQALADAAEMLDAPPVICLGSTTHIAKQLPYHASKRESRRILEASRAECVTLLMPNVFGPYSRPFFNSVVSTFCRIAADGGRPEKIDHAELKLTYIDTLCVRILNAVRSQRKQTVLEFPHEHTVFLPDLWRLLEHFARGGAPDPASCFELQLWNTFRSYR